jgi:anion-transporting  ArsA/GET3 family ATPase
MEREITIGPGGKRLLFVTGKGGIGKSLTAAVLARKAAAMGLKVWLVEQAYHDQLGPLFGNVRVDHDGTALSENLFASNLTLAGNFKDFVVKHLKRGALFELLASQKIVHTFFGAIPGFAELMFLGRLYYSIREAQRTYDLVIVDSYASGHFLNLLTTPRAVIDSGLAGPIVEETTKVLELLSDRQETGILLVGTPEDLVVSEMIDFLPRIAEQSPVKVRQILLNRVLSDLRPDGGVDLDAVNGDVLQRKIALEMQAKEKLMSFINGFDPTLRGIWEFPELGFIEEPIADSFWEVLSQKVLVSRL